MKRKVCNPPPPTIHTVTREPRLPEWSERVLTYWGSIQHTRYSLADLAAKARRGELRLPNFQRHFIWTDRQITGLWESLLTGYHVGNLLLWEQYRLPPTTEVFGDVSILCPERASAHFVVDGQQRLGAIVSVLLSERWYLDMLLGAVTLEPGPWRLPGMLLLADYEDGRRWSFAHAEQYELPRYDVLDAWYGSRAATDRCYLSAVMLSGPEDWPLQRVLESYRRLACEGTPHDLNELEAALQRTLDKK